MVHYSVENDGLFRGKWSIIPWKNGPLFRRKMVHYSAGKMVHYSRSAHTGLSGWLGNRSSIKLTPFGCSSDAAKSKVFSCVIRSSVSPMPRVPLPPDRIRDWWVGRYNWSDVQCCWKYKETIDKTILCAFVICTTNRSCPLIIRRHLLSSIPDHSSSSSLNRNII